MSNPFAAILKIPSRPSTIRPADREQQLTHQALEQSVAVLQALLGDGDPRRGKAVEFFENVTVTSTGTTLKHQLGRQPRGYFMIYQDTNRVIYSNKEGWTEENVVLYTGAGSGVFSFFLFALLLAVLLVPGVALAAECAHFGFTQGDVVKLWICETASDTTTGAAEGDYRYNKDTNAALTYDGAAWNAMGGGSGAPTGAQYWTGAADAGLSAEHNLGALSTGLVINTAGTPSAYAGASCTNQFPRSLSATGAATCASVVAADISGSVGTATALASDPSDCTASTYAQSIAASGNLTCKQVAYSELSGAPSIPADTSGASYWTKVAETGLSNEVALGALATGLILNTTTTGVPTIYGGTSCTNQFPRSLSASGAATCASVASADLNLTATTCTNEFITAISSGAAGTCSKAVLAGAQFASQGTTTTVLHGNAAGNPSWAAVDLTNDTSSVLPLAKLTDDASSGLCLLSGGAGDPAWTTCPGGGGGLSYAQVSAAALAGF